jgi:hypothetical protein
LILDEIIKESQNNFEKCSSSLKTKEDQPSLQSTSKPNGVQKAKPIHI